MKLRPFQVLLLVTILAYCETRVSSRASTTPACYIDNFAMGYFRCGNPLYTNCGDQYNICCGPDHYCCGSGSSCCKRTSLNGWELAGVITSTLAWAALLAVISLLTVPMVVRKYRKRTNNSVHPSGND